jgi:phosphoribosylformylglycinamidine synthase
MAILGWVPWPGIEAVRQPRFVANQSAMFESRFVAIKVMPGPSIFLQGMEDSILGIWVAHGEGRFICTDDSLVREIQERHLAPLRFVDAGGSITEQYPANPNGSALGITALCSADGRHLALMPHPERVFLPWQWPYWPKEWAGIKASPWLRLFQNARTWCDASR